MRTCGYGPLFFSVGMNNIYWVLVQGSDQDELWGNCWFWVCEFRSVVVACLLGLGLSLQGLGFDWNNCTQVLLFGFEEFAGDGFYVKLEEFAGDGICVKLESPELNFNEARSRNSSLLCSSYYSKIDSNKLGMLVS